MSVKVRWMTRRTLGGELGNAYKILLGKHEKIKRPLVRHPRGLEDNIKTYNYYMMFDCFSLGVFLLLCFLYFYCYVCSVYSVPLCCSIYYIIYIICVNGTPVGT
jgi:hypothetical protein